jgi:hypothetical protein
MPRYFFHLEHAAEVRDERGVELSDLDAAKCHAVKTIAEALCEEPKAFWAADQFRMTVTRADGLILFTLEMVSALAPAAGSVSHKPRS